MSSCTPSAKNALSGSLLKLRKGSTAIDLSSFYRWSSQIKRPNPTMPAAEPHSPAKAPPRPARPIDGRIPPRSAPLRASRQRCNACDNSRAEPGRYLYGAGASVDLSNPTTGSGIPRSTSKATGNGVSASLRSAPSRERRANGTSPAIAYQSVTPNKIRNISSGCPPCALPIVRGWKRLMSQKNVLACRVHLPHPPALPARSRLLSPTPLRCYLEEHSRP